ncbi:alpha/beta hydrolase domain-containing protein [Holotrichia oblita]|uniref:Alpha/beta hydrolase domain-containing protein n=3 Tax=Holotrichia oblita TaxID=644536 RepID=A0ACB9THZ1_HOLOL|nr:alpha/beta hydrolase domain-containing protein [Holotrichia oblita]KAI4466412.1 alpha/beta hydrolase domain-containing protein [Holotrichia oblita]KAI4466416.1 alpha/beta hydrolase domain-containing protein [Holotrichia oblita]
MSTFRELCDIFCCPPFPSKIASKLAFVPPEPSYSLINDTENKYCLCFQESAEWQYTEDDKFYIEAIYTRTKRGNRIACFYMKCSDTAVYTILFSHGNAVDMGHMSSFYYGLGKWLNCNVFGYDYSGYGASEGRPTEKDLYADIEAAFAVLTTKYKVKPVHVILYGQSIGTVPTVDLATRQQVGAVILHSALMSGMRVLCPSTSRTWFFDAFPVIDKIEKVTAPTLVIHGKNDNVIDISHGLRIYERCPRAVEPLWVEGHGHDDVDCRCGAYLERLRLFINVELGDQ